jgi:hypothetical protein
VPPLAFWLAAAWAEPPSEEAALALAEGLIVQARADAVDVDWIRKQMWPRALPVQPSDEWFARMAHAMGPDGALGSTIRRSEGVASLSPGPDGIRVLLGSDPMLSVTTYMRDGGPRIDEVTVTHCGLCTEPTRFVVDLLADVQRNADSHYRLLPGVELVVSRHIEENRSLGSGSEWAGMLQVRNHQAGELRRWLTDATVVASEDNVVRLRYADGRVDSWPVVWSDDHWGIDYAGLADDSPLRMSRAGMSHWRQPERLQQAALSMWSPSWTERELGLHIGQNAVGAHVDPRDSSVWVVLMDLDTVLAGVVRVDPYLRDVTVRHPLTPPSERANLPIGRWFARWPTDVSPDGTSLLMTMPGRLFQIDLETGRSQLLLTGGRFTAVSAGPNSAIAAGRKGRLALFHPTGIWEWGVDGTPVDVWTDANNLWAVLDTGAIVQSINRESVLPVRSACCGDLVPDAAMAPSQDELLVACPTVCGNAAERHHLRADDTARNIPGVGSEGRGASWSPEGSWFTTPATGDRAGLLLWDADTDQPVAKAHWEQVHTVSWFPDGEAFVVTDDHGDVWQYTVADLLRREAVTSPPVEGRL